MLETPGDEVRMRIQLTRVFKLRIWMGVRLLRLSLGVLGGRGEVVSE